MSRVAKNPIPLPAGVQVEIASAGRRVTVSGAKGVIAHDLHVDVDVRQENGELRVSARGETTGAKAQSGTARAVLANMVKGVSAGFERKLTILGVGYRAQAQGRTLNLSLGFSHPVEFAVPDGIEVATPSQTEILIKGVDKQQVGEVAAKIRSIRPPEPYKGKGVRYADEVVRQKEAKKK
ncbi:MAG: 50S ribosomal protein L6 [Gammaproteobacteria bacterium]|jgi:large subunit ribosomal protein L6